MSLNGSMSHCFEYNYLKENCTENIIDIRLNLSNETLDSSHAKICEQIVQEKNCYFEVMNQMTLKNSSWNGINCSLIKQDYLKFQECSAQWYLDLFGCSKSHANSLQNVIQMFKFILIIIFTLNL